MTTTLDKMMTFIYYNAILMYALIELKVMVLGYGILYLRTLS